MGGKYRICKICGENIEVGYRAIHLVKDHSIVPDEDILLMHHIEIPDLSPILDKLKPRSKLADDLWEWMTQFFNKDC